MAGSDFSVSTEILWANGDARDLSTYSLVGKLRKHYLSSNSVSLDCSSNGHVLTIGLSGNTSSAMAAGKYVYDVSGTGESNTNFRLVEGMVLVTPRVS